MLLLREGMVIDYLFMSVPVYIGPALFDLTIISLRNMQYCFDIDIDIDDGVYYS